MMEIPKIGCFMLCSVEGEKEDRSQGNRKRRDLKINPKSPRETVSRESKTVHPLRMCLPNFQPKRPTHMFQRKQQENQQ